MIQMSNQHNDNYCSEELRASEMKSKERWTNERVSLVYQEYYKYIKGESGVLSVPQIHQG